MSTNIPITDAMRDALVAGHGEPIEVFDPSTNRTYWLCDPAEASSVYDAWLRREIQVGRDAAARGEVVDWDLQRIIALGEQRLARGTKGS
jgi:hypothetical protein